MAQATMAAIPGLKETYIQLKTRMDKAVDDFRKALASTRTGRASVSMLDSVRVEYYGSLLPLIRWPGACVRGPVDYGAAI